MIYLCRRETDEGFEGCGALWSRWPTSKKVVRAPWRLCPDCTTGEREPRSRKRRKR